jgi:glucose 1-dehydrogenase
MKAIAVFPGKPNSVHLADLPMPSVNDIADGRGVLVRVLRVGVDGTDKEINAAEYGAAPEGYNFLTIGHEGFGQVESVGKNVTEVKPGDYVVATVRRPGKSIYDLIGVSDMTTDDTYYERGINLRHGYLTEYYVDDAEFIVKIPQGLKEVGVVVEKGIHQAYEIQRRLKVWKPKRAAVMGAGTIGLLATLALRLRGLEVVAFGRTLKPYMNANLIEALGAVGNKVMVGTVNANREYFEMGVGDMAQAEAEYPGWLNLLLTHPVKGLENYKELFEKLTTAKGAIKVYMEVAPL